MDSKIFFEVFEDYFANFICQQTFLLTEPSYYPTYSRRYQQLLNRIHKSRNGDANALNITKNRGIDTNPSD